MWQIASAILIVSPERDPDLWYEVMCHHELRN